MRPARDAGIRAETQQPRNTGEERLGPTVANRPSRWQSAGGPSAGPWLKFPCCFPNSFPSPRIRPANQMSHREERRVHAAGAAQNRPANQMSHRERFDNFLSLNDVAEPCHPEPPAGTPSSAPAGRHLCRYRTAKDQSSVGATSKPNLTPRRGFWLGRIRLL
jgi:hypothetical protein